jgi:hypothetical protein
VAKFKLVGFEVFRLVIKKNALFWDTDLVRNDVSEKHVASIFKVEKYMSEESARRLLTTELTAFISAVSKCSAKKKSNSIPTRVFYIP